MQRPFQQFSAVRKSLFLFLLLLCPLVYAENSVKFSLKPESKLWLNGNSTLHAFEGNATALALDSQVELKTGESLKQAVLGHQIKKFTFEVPVEKIKSPTPGLAGNMHSCLKYKQHPNITFRIINYEVTQDSKQSGQLLIKAKGYLSIAGQEKEVVLEETAETTDKYIKITGKKELLMTDFGIKPPTLMFGTVKTENKVVVSWDIFLVVAQ